MVSVPVLLGGAALDIEFVHEHCRPVYDGAVVYARDAFDAIATLEKISLFAPVAIYGYYPVRTNGEELLIFGENEDWSKDEDANSEDLHVVRCRANKVLSFPRAD